ncbi:GntR family transcriptional regulator [Diaminobutyricibacter tongyongensis]|uniref:GntR family transcriptional regulator n=1 Tax=Leifsonia tongyongensis TaxID=1268043 RepID=A0A6L9Y2U4_9MICO|nr:GntR family transcriptional regulator [Diaminobutyricibacter tongyongensis]NEN07979.1 GntR family transcriptional regulator [Diaminobutyricibacter tongyongensis]
MSAESLSGDPGARVQTRGRPFEVFGELSPTAPPPLRGRRSDWVYQELSDAIRSLRLPPGAALSEPAVAAWLQVSRAPAREAITRLADQGLVTVVPQVGTQVAPISMRAVRDAVFIRKALETSAFQDAVSTKELDTRELRTIVERNRKAALDNDLEAFIETDDRLHQLVFALAGVPEVWGLVHGAKLQLDRLRYLNLAVAIDNPEVVSEHQRIVDALDDRDEAAGVAVIHQHSYRILGDTEELRKEHESYFTA